MLCPTAREPKMNASDPRPRTHPYHKFEHRFPPPWSAEETDACFIVRETGRRSLTSISKRSRDGAAKLLTPGDVKVSRGRN
jgi:hypothetical protein